jgi:hypothetical protein
MLPYVVVDGQLDRVSSSPEAAFIDSHTLPAVVRV